MTLQPLLQSTWAIQIHVLALTLAWLVGTWQIFVSRKGSPVHRKLGRVFIALMLTMALVSLFIHVRSPNSAFFGFSLLHLYVPLILGLSALALYGARAHRVRLHRFAVITLYFGSLTFTGLVQIFLVTGGITHRMFFPVS
ncbi:MAG TPA: DUF2306 domain-containing protein [Steroidobacteraceae bacterium]|jgi:uncharacterized membrane protein|nr:DUF2306 domain-containing protein [Steroidobacteraceae bacterium]